MKAKGTDLRVALALAGGEARRILRSVVFLLFLPISVWALLLATPDHTRWSQASIAAAVGLVPLAWCLLVLTNLASLRDGRHDVDTITDTTPSTHTARTGGHLLGGLVGIPVGAALLVVFYVVKDLRSDVSGSPALIELAVPLLIVAGGATVGVAVGRWLPWAPFSAAAIVATMPIAGVFAGKRTGRSRFLGFVADETGTGLAGLDVRRTALHLVWLLAWTGIVAVVALARHRRSPRVLGSAALLAVVAIAAGVGQVADIDDDTAAARADLLNNPRSHQVCEIEDGVTYCAYSDADENVDLWRNAAAAVLTHVPTPVQQDSLVVSQRVPWVSGNSFCGPSETLDLIDATIRDRVAVSKAWPADGDVHPGIATEAGPCGGANFGVLYTAVQVGAWAVGLPPAQSGAGETCAADGQARSVVALWLGASGEGRLTTYRDEITVGGDGRVDMAGWDSPPTWGVDWHPYDLETAVAMTAVPDARVDQALATHWDELIDPATPATRLVQLLDLPTSDTISAPLDTCPVSSRS